MYKQFSYTNFIQTNERNYKILFNKNSKSSIVIPKQSTKIILGVYNKNRRKNWKPFHKRNTYFSKPSYLISKN